MKLTTLILCGTWIGMAAQAQEAGPAVVPPPAVQVPVYSQDLRILIDTTESPECAAWGEQAKHQAELWFPIVAAYLDSPGWQAPREIKLIFKDMDGVAHASGNSISISRHWIQKHPEDIGMIVHEMTHVIQGYPPSPKASWLIEGIADYIRFWLCEPKGQPSKINRATDHYRKGYRVTGAFLAWIEQEYKVLIIREANQALRHGKYDDSLFEKRTGKTLDALWAEFVEARNSAP